jgi:hypothetical protein
MSRKLVGFGETGGNTEANAAKVVCSVLLNGDVTIKVVLGSRHELKKAL